jgi:cytochrome d ubiquinol oxidase subunit I
MSYEVLTAYLLEAGFLGIMLFGRERVPKAVHLFATAMVALGTLISAFWILAANSWMQTPAGFEIRDGRFFPTDWAAIVFNPSFPFRLMHMVTQGNRVKKSCGNKACQEIVVPGGDFAPKA